MAQNQDDFDPVDENLPGLIVGRWFAPTVYVGSGLLDGPVILSFENAPAELGPLFLSMNCAIVGKKITCVCGVIFCM